MNNDEEHKLVIVMVGARHVGKTVYLASLAHTAQISSGDPATIKLLKLHWQELSKGSVPTATAGIFTNLQFTYRGQIEGVLYNMEFKIPDYDGHFAEIISDYESGNKGLHELRNIFEEANGFIIFMPADEADAKTMEALNFEIGHFIHLVRLCFKEQNKIEVPLVIAVNKWDKSDYFHSENEDRDAESYIKSINIYTSLLSTLENYFSDIKIIPLSAYGHNTESDIPKPGAIKPWRVVEPVEYIIKQYFCLLDTNIKEWSKKGQWNKISHALLKTHNSWKRSNENKQYQKILNESQDHCFEILLNKLSEQETADKWSSVLESMPEAKFIQFFSQEQRDKLAQSRKKAIALSYSSLFEKLSKSKSVKDYDYILNNNSDNIYYNEFTTEQKQKLEGLRKNHENIERSIRYKFFIKYIFISSIVIFFCIALFYYFQMEKEFALAMNDQQSPQSQWSNLSKFTSDYGAIPVFSHLFANKLNMAAEKHSSVLTKAWHDLENEIETSGADVNPCSRKKYLDALLPFIKSEGLNLPQNIYNKYQSRLDIANSWCKAREMAQNVSSPADIDAVNQFLITLGNSDDPDKVREILNKRIIELEHAKVREISEKDKLAKKVELNNIISIYKKIIISSDYEDAYNFINEYRKDANPEVQKMLDNVRSGMEDRFYTTLLSFAEKTEDLVSLNKLIKLLYKNDEKYTLSETKQRTVCEILQNKLQNIDRNLIESLDSKIYSAIQLADMQALLRKIEDIDNIKIDSLKFHYTRPADLAAILSQKYENIKKYETIIQTGLKVGNFCVQAERTNSLNLHGRSWSSAFTKNNDLQIYFPGGIEAITANDPNFQDSMKGNIYDLDFGSIDLKEMSGEILLKAGNNSCSSNFRISANELFELVNNGILRIRLNGNCKGLTLIFKK